MTAKCESCAAIADCKLAFGIYWREKSNGGGGCNTPLKPWPKDWRKNNVNKKPSVEIKPESRRGRNKLVWQGEF